MEGVWKHSSLSTARKVRVFNACITSKLLYCLHTEWLNKNELKRFDATSFGEIMRTCFFQEGNWELLCDVGAPSNAGPPKF